MSLIKLNSRFYTHLVKGKNNEKGLLIGNNKGYIKFTINKTHGKNEAI